MRCLRVIGSWLTLLVVLAMVAACVPAPAPAPAPETGEQAAETAPEAVPTVPDTLVMVMNMDDVITLDPHHAYETTNLLIHVNTYDTLVEYRPSDLTQVAPRLADSWSVSDDGLTYTFKLNPTATFVSGNPVTAEDVRFSWMRLINLKGNPSFYADLIASVEAMDDRTVAVTLKEASPAFLGIVAAPAMSVLDSQVVTTHDGTDAEDADQTDTAKEWLDQNSAGSGPYTLASWTSKSEIVLEANDAYWRGAPAIKRVIIKHVADPSTQLQLLQRGDADIVHTLDTDLVAQVKDDPNLNLVIGQTLNMNYLAMSPDPELGGPLSDVRVRQAIAYAVDYDGIINALLQGYADYAPTIIPLGVMGVDPAMKRIQDVDRARELLAEAGYGDGGLELELSYGSSPVRETLAAKLKADLEAVGITLNLRPMELAVYLSDMRAQKLPMALGGWTPDYLDPTMWTDYYSYPDRGISYRIKYNSPEAARLADAVSTEFDPEKRAQAIHDLQVVLMEDAPFIMLFQPQQLVLMAGDIKGFAYHPVHFVSFADLSR